MTLTLEPTPHELDILRREAESRGLPVDLLFNQIMKEAILEMEHPRHEPNDETIAAFEEARRGEGTYARDVDDMFRQCGVS